MPEISLSERIIEARCTDERSWRSQARDLLQLDVGDILVRLDCGRNAVRQILRSHLRYIEEQRRHR